MIGDPGQRTPRPTETAILLLLSTTENYRLRDDEMTETVYFAMLAVISTE